MELCDERSIEGHVRQLLCDKISGNLVGIWLLIAEHLRLGTWDLLRRWTGKESGSVEPRVALPPNTLTLMNPVSITLNAGTVKNSSMPTKLSAGIGQEHSTSIFDMGT